MKKFITFCLMILGVVLLASLDNMAFAQDVVEAKRNFHQILKDKFIEGNPVFMTPVLNLFYTWFGNGN